MNHGDGDWRSGTERQKREPGIETKKGRHSIMKLNHVNLLFGEREDRKPPVLLAVTPPRTGERTLLGVENLLQSIAVPEPFSLELAGDVRRRDPDGPLPRRRGGAPADLIPLPPGPHPRGAAGRRPPAHGRGRAGVEHDAAGRRPRLRAPAHLPGRRPARPRLGPPHRPPGRSDGPAPRRARRGAAAAALPRSRLVRGPHGEGPQASGHGAEGTRLHLPDQAPPDGRHHAGGPWGGGAGRGQGLPVGAGRGGVESRAAGRGAHPWGWLRRAGPGIAGRRPAPACTTPS